MSWNTVSKSRCVVRGLSVLLTFVLAAAPLSAGLRIDAILDKMGEEEWGGAYLLESPSEEAKSIALLSRGSRVSVHLDESKAGYFLVDRPESDETPAKTGWVHRKFLRFAEADATPATKVEVAKTPQERTEEALEALRKQLAALEAKNETLSKRVVTLEKAGGADPGADFLLRLQKLEMEVHSRDSSGLPTVPFPEVSHHADDEKAQPSRVPAMSWIFRGW